MRAGIWTRFFNEIAEVTNGLARTMRDIVRGMITPDGLMLTAIVAVVLGVGTIWFFLGLGYERNSLVSSLMGIGIQHCAPATDRQFLWIILSTFTSGVSAIFLVAEAFSLHSLRQEYRRRNKTLPLKVFVPFGVAFAIFAGGGLAYMVFNC